MDQKAETDGKVGTVSIGNRVDAGLKRCCINRTYIAHGKCNNICFSCYLTIDMKGPLPPTAASWEGERGKLIIGGNTICTPERFNLINIMC